MGFHLTTCPYCSCGCGLLLQEEDHRLIGTHPSTAHPISRGSLCVRGWNCTTAQSHPDRLTVPLIRNGSRLVPASAAEAVGILAERLRAPRATQFGSSTPSQILFAVGPTVANEDALAVKRLADSLGARVCPTELSGVTTARLALKTVLGRRYLPAGLDTVADADLVWTFGLDPGECPQLASRLIQAVRRGAALVEFDVFGKSSPGSKAASICIPPGEFSTAALVLLETIFELVTPAPHIADAPGYHPAATSWLPGRTPFVRDHPWLSDGTARQLVAALLAAERPVAVVGYRWLSSAHSLFQTVRLLEAMALAGLEKRLLVLAGESNSWGTADVIQPTAEDRASLLDLMDPDGAREFAAVVIVGDDLVNRASRPSVLEQRLKRAGTVAVVDRFRTRTTELADVVLPAPAFGEVDGTLTNAFGTVQRWRKAIEPPGQCRPEREWMAGIGRALGSDDWPAEPLEWLREIQRADDHYGRYPVESLYADSAPFGVTLREAGRLAFSSIGNPPASHREETYPLELVYGAHPAIWSTGAVSGREELLRREVSGDTLFLSSDDLKTAGLKAGQRAVVITPHGEAELTVQIDDRLPRGVALVVALPGGPGFALRGFHRDWEGRTLDVQPVPARIGQR